MFNVKMKHMSVSFKQKLRQMSSGAATDNENPYWKWLNNFYPNPTNAFSDFYVLQMCPAKTNNPPSCINKILVVSYTHTKSERGKSKSSVYTIQIQF